MAISLFFLPVGEQTLWAFDFQQFWTFDYILFLTFILGLPILLVPRDGRSRRPVLAFFLLSYVAVTVTRLPQVEEETRTWVLAVGLVLVVLLLAAIALSRSARAHVALPVAGGLAVLAVVTLFAFANQGTLGESFGELGDDAGTILVVVSLFVLLLFVTIGAARWPRGVRLSIILFSLAYFGFLQAACPRLPGALELILLHISEPERVGMHIIKVAVVLTMGIVYGRYYCGWICPKGVIQELIHRPALGVKVPEKVDRALKWGKYVTLVLLVLFPLIWNARLFLHIGPFRVIFNMSGPAYAVAFLVVVLVASVFIDRAYCRYFCPEGGLLALAQLVSPFRVRLDRARCTDCGRCVKACPVDAFVLEGKTPVAISRTECIVCTECAVACRESGIHFGLAGLARATAGEGSAAACVKSPMAPRCDE